MYIPKRRFSLVTILELVTGQLLVLPLKTRNAKIKKMMAFLGSEGEGECQGLLLQQFPDLQSVNTSDLSPETCQAWLNELFRQFGKTLMVNGKTRLPLRATQLLSLARGRPRLLAGEQLPKPLPTLGAGLTIVTIVEHPNLREQTWGASFYLNKFCN